MAQKTVSLNLHVCKLAAKMVRADSKKFNKALGGITERILLYFLTTKTVEEREAFYRSCPNKVMGRKVIAS